MAFPDGSWLRWEVMRLYSYADETFDPAKSKYLIVAGFLMTEAQALSLEVEWKRTLGDLPYFHMREGHHKRYPAVYRELLGLLRRGNVSAGIFVGVDKAHCELRGKEPRGKATLAYWRGGAYTYAVLGYLHRTGVLIESQELKNTAVEYYFEKGHGRCGEANDFLNCIAQDPYFYPVRQQSCYDRHEFVNGKNDEAVLCQAGDIIAWLANQEQVGGARAPEFQQLLSQVDIYFSYSDSENIDESIESNENLGREYEAVRLVRHQERKPRKTVRRSIDLES